MVTNKWDDGDKGFIYSLPSVSPQTFRPRSSERKAEPFAAVSRLSPLSSDLGYCLSGRQCDGSQVVGNLSRRPLKQVAPEGWEGWVGGGGSCRAPVADRAQDKSLFVYGVVFCPPLHSSSHHSAAHHCPPRPPHPLPTSEPPTVPVCSVCFHCAPRSGPSPCAASLIGSSFNTASRCKTAAL